MQRDHAQGPVPKLVTDNAGPSIGSCVDVSAAGHCTKVRSRFTCQDSVLVHVQVEACAQGSFLKLVPDNVGHLIGFFVGVTVAGQWTTSQIQHQLSSQHAGARWQQQGDTSLADSTC